MEKIASFTIDHLALRSGIYLSRRDSRGGVTVSTFDLRITEPNREPAADIAALHTIEHLGATFLRGSKRKEEIVYFGPMGCRTGCYLLMFGSLQPQDGQNRSFGRQTAPQEGQLRAASLATFAASSAIFISSSLTRPSSDSIR